MNTINKLGIRIVVISILVMLLMFGVWKAGAFFISQTPEKTPLPTPTSTPDELAFSPALAETIPLEVQKQIGSYTAEAGKLIGPYTKKYVESLSPDVPKDQVLDPKKVEVFVNTNKGVLLPELFTGTVQTTTKSGKKAIQTYLDAISPVQNPAIKPVTGDMITEALAKQESGEDLQGLVAIRASIENNFTIFKSVKAPKEATELHTKLLQATLALMNNIKLLQNTQQDFIGSLIGQKNLVDLNAEFTDIGTKILALETKYHIK